MLVLKNVGEVIIKSEGDLTVTVQTVRVHGDLPLTFTLSKKHHKGSLRLDGIVIL